MTKVLEKLSYLAETFQKMAFYGQVFRQRSLKSPFYRQFCERLDHYLQVSFSFQAFLSENLRVKYYSGRVALRCSDATFGP
jgi:hypothetical protein